MREGVYQYSAGHWLSSRKRAGPNAGPRANQYPAQRTRGDGLIILAPLHDIRSSQAVGGKELRWQNLSGQEAMLDGDGRTFRQVGESRYPMAA